MLVSFCKIRTDAGSQKGGAEVKKDMTMEETIGRINELYHKSQAEGLTEEEKTEQKELRQRYIDSIKGNLSGSWRACRFRDRTAQSRR